ATTMGGETSGSVGAAEDPTPETFDPVAVAPVATSGLVRSLLRGGSSVAWAPTLSGQLTTSSLPSRLTNDNSILANSSSGFRLFICSLTRRRHSTAYATYSSNSSSEGASIGCRILSNAQSVFLIPFSSRPSTFGPSLTRWVTSS